ncbi:MAG: UDP-N-acetylmuramoyl-L-alanine--D-glutamate ligase [Bacteroidetes bacterium]|nr:UDP-N-acetylmuramoyl-L-alanine--D-glutamate ligase [Bacteroidota bacterium]
MSDKTQKLSILGGAESGVGAAILGKLRGWDVFVSDMGKIREQYRDELNQYAIEFEEQQHSLERILGSDLLIKSPGIPDSAPVVTEARKRGIHVISEIEFAGKYSQARHITITGTNGKTTTTLLTYHILKKAGLNVGLAGNVGKSLARQVALDNREVYVIELSSFQLDGMYEFKSDIAVLLNITPDHMDRYDYRFSNYIYSKFRILQNMTEQDAFIYCYDDPVITETLESRKDRVQKFPFSLSAEIQQGAYIQTETIHFNINDPFTMSIFDLALQGKHNQYNSMAAGIAARVLDIRKDVVRESLMDFENIEHRLEFVTKVHGIEFINDSKATNVNSTWYALESMNTPVIWIAGGVDKGNDYSMLSELVASRVKAIVCLGKENQRIHEAFQGMVEHIIDTHSAAEAVKAAYLLGKKGDSVLLSPACASFDLFENYEDRGRQFKKAVREL